MPRFERDRSFLAVIDAQPGFLDRLGPVDGPALAARIGWLVRVAICFDIPLLVTAEEAGRQGPPSPVISLPEGTPVHDKHVFSLTGQPDILAAARALNRPHAILVGLETDVCVAQSALGLQALGFRVAVIADATGAPGPCHDAGLVRLRDAGVTITTVKGITYEWARDLAGIERLGALRRNLPPGVTL